MFGIGNIYHGDNEKKGDDAMSEKESQRNGALKSRTQSGANGDVLGGT